MGRGCLSNLWHFHSNNFVFYFFLIFIYADYVLVGITWLFLQWPIYLWILLVYGSSETMLGLILVSIFWMFLDSLDLTSSLFWALTCSLQKCFFWNLSCSLQKCRRYESPLCFPACSCRFHSQVDILGFMYVVGHV